MLPLFAFWPQPHAPNPIISPTNHLHSAHWPPHLNKMSSICPFLVRLGGGREGVEWPWPRELTLARGLGMPLARGMPPVGTGLGQGVGGSGYLEVEHTYKGFVCMLNIHIKALCLYLNIHIKALCLYLRQTYSQPLCLRISDSPRIWDSPICTLPARSGPPQILQESEILQDSEILRIPKNLRFSRILRFCELQRFWGSPRIWDSLKFWDSEVQESEILWNTEILKSKNLRFFEILRFWDPRIWDSLKIWGSEVPSPLPPFLLIWWKNHLNKVLLLFAF